MIREESNGTLSSPVSSSSAADDVVDGGSSSTLQQLRDLTSKRRQLLAKCLGARSADQLSALLGTDQDRHRLGRTQSQDRASFAGFSTQHTSADHILNHSRSSLARLGAADNNNANHQHSSPFLFSSSDQSSAAAHTSAFVVAKRNVSVDAPQSAAKRAKARGQDSDEEIESFEDYFQVLQEEEQYYRGSISFLKGTQSANPHNDYSQHFVDTGQRPQNFIRDAGLTERFDEYPKLKELIRLKDELVSDTATPPMYLKTDLRTFDLLELGSRFDVIIVEPPLEEYHLSGGDCWSWDQLEQLDISSIADNRSFVWLWCGCSPEGLDRGRQCLKKWGFRRCEDICWVKRNSVKNSSKRPTDSNALFQRTKEHCLMGIKGTVRRSTDGDFIHANVDIDLIITDEPPEGSTEKPSEIFLIAEHFCLGRRRLHLFGGDEAIRPGWLTAGPRLTSSSFEPRKFRQQFDRQPGPTTGCTDRIETLRPKSPQPSDKRGPAGQGGSNGHGPQGMHGHQKSGRGGGDSSNGRRNNRRAPSYNARGRR